MEKVLNVLMGLILSVIVKVKEVSVYIVEDIFYVTEEVEVVRVLTTMRVIVNKDLKPKVLTEPRNRFAVINYRDIMRC